jgi:hypothetical protein
MRHLIKVMGERNTGTRAVIRMLSALENVKLAGRPRNLVRPADDPLLRQVQTSLKGSWAKQYRDAIRDQDSTAAGALHAWKHACARFEPEMLGLDLSVVFMVRNPYSWLVALYNRPYHQKGPRAYSLHNFLRQPWMTERRDATAEIVLECPMRLWSLKVASYERFTELTEGDDVEAVWIRLEDFVMDPVRVLSDVLCKLEIPGAEGLKVTEPTKARSGSLEDMQDYHCRQLWRRGLTSEAVAEINRHVDWDLAESFGYQRLDPAEFRDGARISLNGEAGSATAA